MDFRRALGSALQIFVVFSFFSAGFFFFFLPFLPGIRFQLSDFLLNEVELCTPLGIAFLVAAFLLLIGFGGLNRGRFMYIEMGTHTVSVEAALIRHSLEECFKTHFPQKIQLSNMEILRGKKIEIGVSLISLDPRDQPQVLRAVEKHVQHLLRQRFGYIKPFRLNVKSS